jgi:hypothetical protein
LICDIGFSTRGDIHYIGNPSRIQSIKTGKICAKRYPARRCCRGELA